MFPDSTAPLFARFTEKGRVHVLRFHLDDYGNAEYSLLPFGCLPGDDLSGRVFGALEWLYARQVSLCGKTGDAGPTHGVSAFSDDDICAACVHLVPEGERHRLFEHDLEEAR